MIDFSMEDVIESPDDLMAVIGKEYYFIKTSLELFKFKTGNTTSTSKGILDGKGNPYKVSLNDGNSRMFWKKGLEYGNGFSYIIEVE